MDEKLNRRLQIAGATAIAVSYFLPWASIMSPFGSIQIKGLYIDYAWVLLVCALLHLGVQFASTSREALGLPENAQRYLTFLHRIVPLLITGFIAWQGAWFAFNARSSSTRTIFGNEMTSAVRAGLDYGYWIAVCGVLLLVVAVAASIKQLPRFSTAVVGIVLVATAIAFGLSRNREKSVPTAASNPVPVVRDTDAKDTETARPTMPEFDSSPFLQTVAIKARVLGKDYEASRYRSEIVITPTFRNVSQKTIVGIRGRITMLDGFNREVYSFGFRDDDKLAAGAESRRSGGYSFEDNELEDDDPFSKMYPLVNADTAKYRLAVLEIAFSDGTVMPSSGDPKAH